MEEEIASPRDQTFILDGYKSANQMNFDDDMGDIDEPEPEPINDDDYIPDGDDPEDNEFTIEGYQESRAASDRDDAEYDDGITGDKRKRTLSGIYLRTIRAAEHSAARTSNKESEGFMLDEGDFNTINTRTLGTFGRRKEKDGIFPAYHKRIQANMDSDDELMLTMRANGFSDKQIADKLIRDGRVRYNEKSISTRIGRLRLAQAANVDFLIQEGYKEWQFEDDLLLMKAYQLADIEVSYELERIRSWRFRKVSEYMRKLDKNALFSDKACKERYCAIVEGTARIPTEVDDDPDARRAEMEEYRTRREQTREEERIARENRQAHELKIREDTKARQAQKAEETAMKRAEREQAKATRAMQRAANQQLRAQRAVENKKARIEANAKAKAEKAAREREETRKKGNITANTSIVLKDVMADTPDPRSTLSVSDLQKLCKDRGIHTVTVKMHGAFDSSKEELVQRLKDYDDLFSLNELKTMARTEGLNVTGNKTQIKYQLAFAAAQVCASFHQCVGEVDNSNDVKIKGSKHHAEGAAMSDVGTNNIIDLGPGINDSKLE